jgi:hypothetical protein
VRNEGGFQSLSPAPSAQTALRLPDIGVFETNRLVALARETEEA